MTFSCWLALIHRKENVHKYYLNTMVGGGPLVGSGETTPFPLMYQENERIKGF